MTRGCGRSAEDLCGEIRPYDEHFGGSPIESARGSRGELSGSVSGFCSGT